MRGLVRVLTAFGAALALSACGGSSSNTHPHTTSTPTATTPLTISTPSTSTTTTGTTTPTGGPVPAHTSAVSITFISPSDAYVLGTAPCSHSPCSAILRSTNRGSTWVGLPAPREAVSQYLGNGLWGLRFADAVHGYAFGQGLWETSDGGGSWRRATPPAPVVLSLEAVQDQRLVALAASCLPGGNCHSGMGLYRAEIGGSWSKVANLSAMNAYAGSIAVHGADVWVVAANRIYYSTNGGASFTSESQPCGASKAQPGSITDDGTHVYLLCIGGAFTGHTIKYLYATTGPGAGWSLVGKPPTPGDGGQISAGSDSSIVIASASAASWLYRSTNGGHTWTAAVTEDDGGEGWADLGFTTSTDAVVIHGPPIGDGGGGRPGQILLSEDGGATWHPAGF